MNVKLRESVVLFGQLTQLYLENGIARGFLRAGLDAETTALAVNAMIFEGVRHIAVADDVEKAAARWTAAVIALMFDGVAK